MFELITILIKILSYGQNFIFLLLSELIILEIFFLMIFIFKRQKKFIFSPVIDKVVTNYLTAFFNKDKKDKEKIEITPPYEPSGTEEANKPTVGYKHPCKYCDKLIPPNSTVCPFCQKVNPLGPFRCPKCHEPIEREWNTCSRCSQNLKITCPYCQKITFFGDYCDNCGKRLLIICPNCGQEQPPISDNCIKCQTPFKRSESNNKN